MSRESLWTLSSEIGWFSPEVGGQGKLCRESGVGAEI